MDCEIYRPLGMYIIVTQADNSIEKLPIVNLSVGKLTFSLSDSTPANDLYVKGVEVHGELIEINSLIEFIGDSRGSISWSTYSFDFSLFQAWVSGLSIEQKEELITDLVGWHEELENVVYSEADHYKRSA